MAGGINPLGQTLGSVDSNNALRVVAAAGSGIGTVTSVSVTTANGVSGVVATPTTTPAITVTLGAITPTSIDTTSYKAGGVAGVTAGPLTLITSITVKNGIITAITGS